MISSNIVGVRTLDDQVDDQHRSNKQCERIDELVDHGVGHIGVFGPDVSLGEDASEVTSPCISRPPQDLHEESPVRFHC